MIFFKHPECLRKRAQTKVTTQIRIQSNAVRAECPKSQEASQ